MASAGDHRGGLPIALAGALSAAVACSAACRVAVGQVGTGDQHQGFVTRKQPAAVGEAFEDFERYRDHQAWEKAFAALAKVSDAAGDRLVAGPDGLAVPVPVKVRRELLSLPPDGREAYRLFNDPKAQQLFKQATATPPGAGEAAVDDVPLLRQLVDQYFVTAVGDQAADRLGDALFEAGDFAGAEACWRLVVDEYPDTTLSTPLLQVKRAVALADAGQAAAFEQVRAAVHDRYAGQAVHLGGRDADAAAYVDGLAVRGGRSPTTAPADAPLALPASDEAAWQVPLLDESTAKQVESRLMNFGWGRLAGEILAAVPPVAADAKRVYVTWYGATLAVDVRTGKLLWRTASPSAVAEGLLSGMMQGNAPSVGGSGIALAGPDRVLVVGPAAAAAANNGRRGRVVVNGVIQNPGGTPSLTCLAADTGRAVWTTSVGPMSAMTFVGPPLVGQGGDKGCVYAVATDGPKGEYALLSVGLADGVMRAKVMLGTPQFPTDPYRGQPLPRPPALLARGGRVLVLTNDGAVLCVDPAGGRLDWAFTFPPQPDAMGNVYYNYAAPPPPDAPGAMAVAGSTLVVKECGSTTMYGIDLSGPSISWHRPVDAASGLAAVAGDDLVMVGPSVDAIDGATRAMRWSTVVSVAAGDVAAVLAGGHVYAFGRRGVSDTALADGSDGGRTFRGADRDAAGGKLLRVGGKLITVSAGAVTAYPLAGGH